MYDSNQGTAADGYGQGSYGFGQGSQGTLLGGDPTEMQAGAPSTNPQGPTPPALTFGTGGAQPGTTITGQGGRGMGQGQMGGAKPLLSALLGLGGPQQAPQHERFGDRTPGGRPPITRFAPRPGQGTLGAGTHGMIGGAPGGRLIGESKAQPVALPPPRQGTDGTGGRPKQGTL